MLRQSGPPVVYLRATGFFDGLFLRTIRYVDAPLPLVRGRGAAFID